LKKTAYRETGLLLLGDVFRKNKWNKQAVEAREKALSSASQWMPGLISKDHAPAKASAVWASGGDGGWRRVDSKLGGGHRRCGDRQSLN
jgi:hypothetical protein